MFFNLKYTTKRKQNRETNWLLNINVFSSVQIHDFNVISIAVENEAAWTPFVVDIVDRYTRAFEFELQQDSDVDGIRRTVVGHTNLRLHKEWRVVVTHIQ